MFSLAGEVWIHAKGLVECLGDRDGTMCSCMFFDF
jgi:hypothetical protein